MGKKKEKAPGKQEPIKKIYPMVAMSIEETNQPEIPLQGNLTFLRMCKEFLTPEEIKAAIEKGNGDQKDEPKKPRPKWTSLDDEGRKDLLSQIETKFNIRPRKVTSKSYKEDKRGYMESFAPKIQRRGKTRSYRQSTDVFPEPSIISLSF